MPISSLLDLTQLAINGVERDADTQKRMANYGFSAKRIQECKALRQEVVMLHDVKENIYDENWSLAHQLNIDMQKANETFKEHAGVARTAFRKDPALLHALKIKSIATRRWEWPKQALNFYIKLEKHGVTMEPYDVRQEDLQQMKATIEAILDQRAERTRKKGEAESSTQYRNQAVRVLQDWLTEFHAIARIAFKDNPQILESFGISVPSKK